MIRNRQSGLLPSLSTFIVLIGAMLVSGTLPLLLGQDLNWDLTNYHYYNPYAFLHHRYDIDYWPAGQHTYINPALDFLTYFLINTLLPRVVGFTFGAI